MMWCFPKRYLIALLTCLGFVLITFLRNANENKLRQFFHTERQNLHLPSEYFICLLTFSIGQLTSLVGGIISNRNGGAVAFGVGMLSCALINMSFDFLYSISLASLLAAIFIDGMLQGLMYSSVADVWSRWTTVQHRSKYISFTLTGYCIGPMLQKLFSLITISQKTGMEVEDIIFKLQAVAAIIFAFVWLLLVKDDPSQDNTLSEYERIILQERLKFLDEKSVVLAHYPWMKVLTSQSLWVLNTAAFLNGSSYFLTNYSLSTHVTTIIYDAYNISYLEIIEGINTIKYIFIFTITITTGCIIDRFRYMNTLTNSKNQDLKIIVCISFIVQGIILIAYYWFNFAPIELLLFMLLLLFSTYTTVAIQVIVIDLSPRYASLLNGIQNSFFYFAFTYLEVFSFLVEHHSRWPKMIPFVAAIAGFYIIGGLFYCVFGSTQLQPWNDSPKNEHEIEQPTNGIGMSD